MFLCIHSIGCYLPETFFFLVEVVLKLVLILDSLKPLFFHYLFFFFLLYLVGCCLAETFMFLAK